MNPFQPSITQTIIGIKGAGEMASAVAWRLYQANLRNIYMMEIPNPKAVRRQVAFCEAVYNGSQIVEGVSAVRVETTPDIHEAWKKGAIAVIADPAGLTLKAIQTDVLIDAIIAKRNLGTRRSDAPLVIGLGPGFCAGNDVHLVIETNRGHNLGRIIASGPAEPNTGIPGNIGGYANRRVLRAPSDGVFKGVMNIGDRVEKGTVVGTVGRRQVVAQIDGVIRGLIRSGGRVRSNLKLGDIDPRGATQYCNTISDKARAVSGSVLEAILRKMLQASEPG